MDLESIQQQQKTKKINELENDIKTYAKRAKQDDGDGAWYMLSNACKYLAILQNEPQLYTRAIQCITKAIELNPANGIYYVHRIELCLILYSSFLDGCVSKYQNEKPDVDFEKYTRISHIESDIEYAKKLIGENSVGQDLLKKIIVGLEDYKTKVAKFKKNYEASN